MNRPTEPAAGVTPALRELLAALLRLVHEVVRAARGRPRGPARRAGRPVGSTPAGPPQAWLDYVEAHDPVWMTHSNPPPMEVADAGPITSQRPRPDVVRPRIPALARLRTRLMSGDRPRRQQLRHPETQDTVAVPAPLFATSPSATRPASGASGRSAREDAKEVAEDFGRVTTPVAGIGPDLGPEAPARTRRARLLPIPTGSAGPAEPQRPVRHNWEVAPLEQPEPIAPVSPRGRIEELPVRRPVRADQAVRPAIGVRHAEVVELTDRWPALPEPVDIDSPDGHPSGAVSRIWGRLDADQVDPTITAQRRL